MATTNHYDLTKKQLIILNLLYRFRFATSQLLAGSINIHKTTINKRLQLLMEQGYIGRKYNSDYRLLRKHAVYYLQPLGAKTLKNLSATKYASTTLRNTSTNKTASDQFIEHSLAVYSVYCTLKTKYGDNLQFFTKAQLTGFDYFPKQLPDAYIQLGKGSDQKHFFLDILHETQPFFLSTRRIMQYIVYEGSGDWVITGSKLPKILLICDTPALQKRLTKRMSRVIGDIDTDDLQFFTTVLGQPDSGMPWRNMAEVDDESNTSDNQ